MSTNVIAIDGPVASGKGTIARLLASKLGWTNLSTGDIYRGMSVYMMRKNIDPFKTEQVVAALEDLNMRVTIRDGVTLVFLSDEDITGELKTIEASKFVYKIALIPHVRAHANKIQNIIAKDNNIICEGRDIGSVVFPDAKYKFYLDASVDVRAHRRWLQDRLQDPKLTVDQCKAGLQKRDLMDMNRKESPLVIAKGAIVVNTDNKSPEQVVDEMLWAIKGG